MSTIKPGKDGVMPKKHDPTEPCPNCKCTRKTPCGCMKPKGWKDPEEGGSKEKEA